ncbi:GNAT family N-acetyltransferase [Clostridium sp. D2Q-11]|uniref:GNAT family N-acetyltransferase n=1 Tax=Anaeromonas frigoriresistens TaxID=2683708 RepID=A0A942Z989_9FIRM|nr:GNAT family N-acetyltransferase [Anaeromonas frigoriresistens]MBS4538640.1 GNAT family N-acetyltransferase [Anaeromonas frigoriresistens]
MITLKFINNLFDILPFKDTMWELLCLCDKDFYPPLSTRENNPLGPTKYFEGLFTDKSNFILAFSKDKLVGFSIFYHNYYEDLIAQYTPCNYVKIACVHPEHRGQKIASRFNRFIEEQLPFELVLPFIVRRTWSSNFPQMRLLQNYGYTLFHMFENDRGDGISTVFFSKCIQPMEAIS